MNKKVIEIAAISLILLLSSCGMSEEAKMADDLIAQIGTVTLNNEKAILAAEEAVKALPEDQQKKLKNIEILNDARDTYNDLKADVVESAIDAIGDVTLNSGEKIAKAREEYEALETYLRHRVSNYSKLREAEKLYPQLRIDNVIQLINAIGSKITLESGEAIQKAQTAYDMLSWQEQIDVTNASELEKAADLLWNLKKSTMDRDDRFKKSTDIIKGQTWYYSKKEYDQLYSGLGPYIGIVEREGVRKIALIVEYECIYGSLLLFDEGIIHVDGKNYSAYFNSNEIGYERFTDSSYRMYGNHIIYESDDDLKDVIAMLEAVANSETTLLRYVNNNSGKSSAGWDISVPDTTKEAIKEILEAFKMLTGK